MRGLKEKVAVIAGGSGENIGAFTAVRLAEEGCKVVVADLDATGAEAVAARINAAGGQAVGSWVNVADEDSYRELVAFAVHTFGGVDGLFNVAADPARGQHGGADGRPDLDVLEIDNEIWQRTFDVTLTGYMYGIRHVLPVMIERGGGSIVNTMSAAVWMAEPRRVAYASAKAGVAALTRHTATIGGKRGVRCNAIAPGTVRTPHNISAMTPEEVDRQIAATRSTRLGKPDDIAAMVAFLFSEDGSWINGQTIVVDGGAVLR
jgi:NAD(P)-dependent dehydrogenase (short-subunit alcohol dehydrogenase family)